LHSLVCLCVCHEQAAGSGQAVLLAVTGSRNMWYQNLACSWCAGQLLSPDGSFLLQQGAEAAAAAPTRGLSGRSAACHVLHNRTRVNIWQTQQQWRSCCCYHIPALLTRGSLAAAQACPYCGSVVTRHIVRFGSTAC
jgi:hypothetical protein